MKSQSLLFLRAGGAVATIGELEIMVSFINKNSAEVDIEPALDKVTAA